MRGLGILNIKDLFGVTSVRERKRIDVVVRLVEWSDTDDTIASASSNTPTRCSASESASSRVPVRPGRDMGSILEMAARNELLRRAGRNASQEFIGRLERQLVTDADRDPESLAAPPVEAIEDRESELPKAPSDRPTWSQLGGAGERGTESSA